MHPDWLLWTTIDTAPWIGAYSYGQNEMRSLTSMGGVVEIRRPNWLPTYCRKPPCEDFSGGSGPKHKLRISGGEGVLLKIEQGL